MDDSRELAALHEAIRNAYKSYDNPDFTFVKESMARRPYERVIPPLMTWFWVKDDTEINYDVAFRYHLYDAGSYWRLALSMVEPYAVLLQIGVDNVSQVIAPGVETSDPREKWLLGWLAEHQIVVLPNEILAQPVPLTLTNVEVQDARVYQALFTDTATLPWEKPRY